MLSQSSQLLLAQVQRTLKQRQLMPKNQRLLVAVSGGQDSLCLLKILLDLQSKWGWYLAVAHCDHQWEHDVGIANHVASIVNSWQVTFYLKTAVKVSETEEAARRWRYQALIEIAEEQDFKYVVTAHTLSDRTETFLYNLMRGSGADGLQSLTWKRQLAPGINLVRPLLAVTRAETGNFCEDLQLPIWEDVYNQQLKYARNRIRQELIPYLKTHFNPQVEKNIAQTAELLRADVEYLEQVALELRQKVVIKEQESTEFTSGYRLNRRLLNEAPLAIQRRVIRQFLQEILPINPNFEHIEKLTALIIAPNRSQTDTFPGGAIAMVKGEWISVNFSN